MSYSFTVDRDLFIAREVAMFFIKNYIVYNDKCSFKFSYIWTCYQLWLREQYTDNINRIISTTEFIELLNFKFDKCLTPKGKYKLQINIV